MPLNINSFYLNYKKCVVVSLNSDASVVNSFMYIHFKKIYSSIHWQGGGSVAPVAAAAPPPVASPELPPVSLAPVQVIASHGQMQCCGSVLF